jgi:hypothetical protein
MLARCCPPGTRNGDGCESCIPCEGHHLKGSAYFTSGADRLFKESNRFKPVRNQRSYEQKKRARAQDRLNRAHAAQDLWREHP